jgi:D-alanine-D-alanine ligase
MGGWSSERPISLRSGNAVIGGLKEAGCDPVPLDIKDSTTVREEIERAGLDAAFIALHGHFGEDGGIQILLDKLGIPYTGSSAEASRRAMNKVLFREIMTEAKIRMPKGVILKLKGNAFAPSSKLQVPSLSFDPPWVVKPSIEGSSIGVSIVDNEQELSKAVENAARYSPSVMVEEYIKGMEITVGILQEQSLPPIEIVPKNRFYDYESKYGGGTEYLIPARISDSQNREAGRIGLAVHQLIGCRNFSRVDMILGKDGELYILEVNTIPGLTDKSLLPKAAAAEGISFRELCVKILESALAVKNE